MVSSAASTAWTPRAHYTNPGTLECLRDIGLEQEARKQGTSSAEAYQYVRWVNTVAGEQYARLKLRGHDPTRIGDYLQASPCELLDLPQTQSEPMLTQFAMHHGIQMRWNTEYLYSSQDCERNTVLSTLLDKELGQKFQVRSKFLAGADGGRSRIVQELGLLLVDQGSGGIAYNVLVEADMTNIVEHSKAVMHWIGQPDREYPNYAWQGFARMIKPWHEWIFGFFPAPGVGDVNVSDEQWVQRCKDFIGDDSVEVKLKQVAKWRINQCYVETHSKGNIFCLGDAVHRHPPNNGFGSNTSIQDAYNLAWKLAYVLRRQAGRGLLETYNVERQPIGQEIVRYANASMRDNMAMMACLGMMEPSLQRRQSILKTLESDTEEGREARAEWRDAARRQDYQFSALGAELNHRYRSDAVYLDDEPAGPPSYKKDPYLFYEPNTYPGFRLPHAWLNSENPIKPLSTHDVAGKGKFHIFTGVGGKEVWKTAADKASKSLGVTVDVTSIGWRQDYEDCDFVWEKVRGVSEGGAVLIRPDRFVAWRSHGKQGATQQKLEEVVKRVLCQ